jgi:homoserine O-acetyltransferase
MSVALADALETDVAIGDLRLVNGLTLPDVVQRVMILGAQPAPDGSNVALVPHALTGSANVADWWGGIVAAGAPLDLDRWCVVGINALGGWYGSTGPTSIAPDGRVWGPRFPVVTVADIVEAQRRALASLGITRLAIVAGGSLGGFQTLQWVRAHGDLVGHALVVGATDHLRAQALAQNGLARDAIALDPAFAGGWYGETQPAAGLRLARGIATLTYKSEALFETRFGNRPNRSGGDPTRTLVDGFDVEGYLALQGDRFAARVDANAYRTLTRAMDLFDLRGREAPAGTTRLTFVGITGDQLFAPEHVRATAERWQRAGWDAVYLEQRSDHGHDAFLAEVAELALVLAERFTKNT